MGAELMQTYPVALHIPSVSGELAVHEEMQLVMPTADADLVAIR
jgi:hypothetical protein